MRKSLGRGKSPRIPRSGTIFVVIGFAWGATILLFDYFPFDDQYLKTTPFQLYFLAVVSQTVFWAIAAGTMWPSVKSLKDLDKYSRSEVVLWSILFIVLIYSSTYFSVSCQDYGLRHHNLKTNLLTVSGGIVAVLAGIGSLFVNMELREMLHGRTSAAGLEMEKTNAQPVVQYLELRGKLLHFVSVLGVMLGLAAVALSAKRYLILKSSSPQCSFEWEKVFVYGLYYTLILVLTFLPTFSVLIATAHRLRDDIFPMPSPNSDSWSSTCAKREKLEKLLALSMAQGLRAIIAILAPIAGSLLSLVKRLF